MRATRRRLVIASNRGPISYGRSGGQRTARRGGGGLVTALSGLVASQDVTWVAAAISAEDEAVAAEHEDGLEETDRSGNPFRLRLVRLDRADYDRYYNVFANPLLWFIQHGLWNRPYTPEMSAATRAAWDSYRRVNEAFATAVAAECDGADAVLVHDYQLYLVPRMLRAAGMRAPLSHFTHIPWPGPDAWRVLTDDMRTGLLEGLLGADVIGFHTARSVRAFLATAEEFLAEAEVDHVRPRVTLGDDVAHVRAYPSRSTRTSSRCSRSTSWCWPRRSGSRRSGRSGWCSGSTAPTPPRTWCGGSTPSRASWPATRSGTAASGCWRYWIRRGRRSLTMRSTLERSIVPRVR